MLAPMLMRSSVGQMSPALPGGERTLTLNA